MSKPLSDPGTGENATTTMPVLPVQAAPSPGSARDGASWLRERGHCLPRVGLDALDAWTGHGGELRCPEQNSQRKKEIANAPRQWASTVQKTLNSGPRTTPERLPPCREAGYQRLVRGRFPIALR